MFQSNTLPLSGSGSGSAVSPWGLLELVWRARYLMVLFFVPTVLGTYVVMRQKPMVFTAEGALIVGAQRTNIRELEAAVGSLPGDVASVRSEISVLTSRSLIRDAANELHLAALPEFNPLIRPQKDTVFDKLDPRPYIDRVIARFSDEPTPLAPGPPTPSEVAALTDDLVENYVLANLGVYNDARDYVIHMTFRSENPKVSADLINALMTRYISQQIAAKVGANTEASSILNDRINALQRDATVAADRLQEYATKAGVVETRMGTVSSQQLADINSQLTQARADRSALDARYQEALAAQRAGSLTNASLDVLESPIIQRLRSQEAELISKSADLATKLGPSHPDRKAVEAQLHDIRALISVEIGKVVSSLRSQVEAARTKEGAFQGRLSGAENQAQSSAGNDAMYSRLKADYEAKQRVYADLLSRIAQTSQPTDQQQADARIISYAVQPTNPSGPRVMLTTVIAGLVSLFAAFSLMLLWNGIDRGFSNLDEVEHYTGLPGLAALPEIRRRGRRRLPQTYVLDNPFSPFAETLRGFRARLRTLAGVKSLKVVLITSSVPGEGKTSFALALARLTAKDGQKVLMLECDLRRPTLHGALPAKDVDLIDVFSGKADWRESIGIDQPSGLHYITAHEDVPYASPLFEAPGFSRLIEQVRSEYDLILIDSPPAMRVSDASLLARVADAVLLVVCWKQTRRALALKALKRLSPARDTLLGVVLTKVNARKGGHDMYSGYSR